MLIFLCFGSYIGEAIAAEIDLSSQGTGTQSENVKFDVYLDEVDTSVKEKTADINLSEMKLYISVNVQDGGYLNNPEIELVDSNFKFKNSPEEKKFKLSNSIQSEDGITVGIPVIAKDDELYNLSLLDMQSQIRLTGEYIAADGDVIDIDTTKAVKITWTANELTKEDILLTQEVITNKIYNMDGTNKRVVQVLVKSQIKDNKAPVKSSTIEIENPAIGFSPEKVKVASYGTEATNGKTSWSSTSKDGKTNIEILNNANDDNIISWTRNAEDIFVITYIYDEDVEISTFVSNVKNTIYIYGRTAGAIEKTNQLSLTTAEQLATITNIGNIADLKTSITENIYKGKMYIGEDTTYREEATVYVPYNSIANTITIEDLSDTALTKAEEGEEPNVVTGISTYYKTTKINKAQAIKVLGTTGTIKVYNAENKTTPIQEIILSQETEEDYYTISYAEGVNKISIVMSTAQEEGMIEIINEKTIKVTNTEVVSNAIQLKANKNLLVTDTIVTDETTNTIEMVNSNVADTADLLEPKTTFDISLDKKSLSTQTENDVRITAELISKDESNKLFKETEKPITINVELPAEVTEASIENITPVVGNDELTLKSYDIVGNKVVVELQGEQTKYTSNSATITIDLKVKTNAFVADKNVEIKATCINDAETVESKETIQLKSKSGLVTKNTLTVGTNVTEEVNNNDLSATITGNTNANISTAIINNFGENISDINIVGNIPNGITLTNAISSNTKGVAISYSEDLSSWKTEVADYSKIKAFKITLTEMVNTSVIDLSYNIAVNIQNIENTTALTNQLAINYVINEQLKQENIVYTLNAVKQGSQDSLMAATLDETDKTTITITPKTKTNTLYEGQILTYEIKVKNATSEEMSNVKLNYVIPEGAVVTELTYAQGSTIEFEDDTTIKNKEWNIETLAPNQTVTKEITLKIKEGANEIINKATLKDEQDNVIAEFQSEPVKINEGRISAMLSRRDNATIDLTSGSTIQYIVIVKNNTEIAMNNVKVTSQVPEQALWIEESEDNTDWKYDSSSREIEYTINTLSSGETKEIRFEVEVDEINNDTCQATIENTAVVRTETGENYETNVYTSNVLVPKLDIHMTSEHKSELKEGDSVKYIIKVTNTGKRSATVYVEDTLPEEIQFRKLTYYTDENKKVEDEVTKQEIGVLYPVEIGETLIIIIEGVTYDLDDDISSKQISNVAKISLGEEEYLESETITNIIINDIVKEPEEPVNPENPEEPKEPVNPEEPKEPGNDSNKEKYSISGLAWLDENKNGIRDNQEKTLELLEVILLDNKGKQLDKTITSLTGTYKFSNLDKGEYIIAFRYDTEKYFVAKYQVSGANETNNSDVIAKEITLNNENKTVGITDTIKLDDKNVENIDVGLIENPEFDLSLNKYISKVVVTNNEGTSTYTYEDTELAKIEIGAKYISGTVLLVEYEIEIANEGDVSGYVTDIIDYLPEELEFNSEMNKEWYMGKDNYLHYMAVDPQGIEPGKKQTVKLVLTKTLKSNSTGTIENTAEIFESANLEAIKESDSVAGNKKEGEDDIAKASLIVSIRTGSPLMYIGIVIGSMLVLGLGIYIINKKILRVKI